MILNLVDYVKNDLFQNNNIKDKFAVISDTEIKTKGDFYKIEALEPVGQIVALADKYDIVFVVLNRLNYDNIFRVYKNNRNNICIINLNSGFSGIGKKTISCDMDDIYIKSNVNVLEPMDKENLVFFVSEFLNERKITHIRISNKEVEEKIGNDEVNLDYKEIVNFNQFGFTGFSGTVICYGNLLQETINAVGLLQSEGIGVDMFWIGNFKQELDSEIIGSLENQDKIFIVGDFDSSVYKDYLYSKLYSAGIMKEEVYFITPYIGKQVINEFLSEEVKMSPVQIYERIKKDIEQ